MTSTIPESLESLERFPARAVGDQPPPMTATAAAAAAL